MKESCKTLAELGKFGLTDHLAARFITRNDTTLQGTGDDASVSYFNEPLTVTAQQLSLEGVDFDLTYVPLKFVGYKTAIGAMGQVMAMNATPMQLLVTAGVSQRFYVEDLDHLFDGIAAACGRYNADLTSIDIKSSYTGLSLCITAVGQAPTGVLTRRSGANENDVVCLSGNVGGAYMGLRLLEREKKVFTGQGADGQADRLPKLEGYSYILERYLKPELPSALLENLRQDDIIPTSMCLLTNGLAHGIISVCQASGMGAKLFLEKIPIARQCYAFAEEMERERAANAESGGATNDTSLIDPIVAAMNGGDDYELLFTLPAAVYQQMAKEYSLDAIGYICPAETGCVLVTPNGQALHIETPGLKE